MNSKVNIICIAILLIALLGSCEKDFDTPQDALPKVETGTATLTASGKIRLTGNITGEGAGSIKYSGFFMGATPQIGIRDNQILRQGGSGAFAVEIDPVAPGDTLYFNTFVANKYGYSIGSVKSFIMAHPEPPEVPCTPVDNSVEFGGFTYPDGSCYGGTSMASWGKYAARGSWFSSGGPEVTIEFTREKPINGIYTVGDILSYPNNTSLVMVRILQFETHYCDYGGKVYVSENADGSYYLTFCDLRYMASGTEFSLRGRMLVK